MKPTPNTGNTGARGAALKLSSILLVSGIMLVWGCGSSGQESAPATCCAAGETTCREGTLLTCNSSGTDLSFTRCPSGACSGGTCASLKCQGPVGSRRCDLSDPERRTLIECGQSGTELPSKCDDGEVCAEGACLSAPCKKGEKTCGFADVLVCTTDDPASKTPWEKVQICGGKGEICDAASGTCGPRACEPGSRSCNGSNVILCDASGRKGTQTPCGDERICRNGHCIAAVCGQGGAPPADAGAGDPGPEDPGTLADIPLPDGLVTPDIPKVKPELKPISRAQARLDGEILVFTAGKEAQWVSMGADTEDMALQISMSKGTRKVEIQVTGLEEFQVGKWTEADTSVVAVEVRWSDGFTQVGQGEQGCSTVGWTSCSATYELVLSSFEQPGGRVRGTFQTTLNDGTELTEGTFDVERLK